MREPMLRDDLDRILRNGLALKIEPRAGEFENAIAPGIHISRAN